MTRNLRLTEEQYEARVASRVGPAPKQPDRSRRARRVGAGKPILATESQIQSAFVAWTRQAQDRYPALRLAFSVPNGAWTRNYAMAAKLRKEGLRPGVPDWMLPQSKTPGTMNHPAWYGLAIEFKRPGAKATKEQLEYLGLLRQAGWGVHICDDWEKAKAIVEEYLS